MEFEVDIDISLCSLKHSGLLNRTNPVTQVAKHFDLVDVFNTKEMWQAQNNNNNYCSTGYRWQFSKDSTWKHGDIAKNYIYQLDTGFYHLIEKERVKFELFYDLNCPAIYTDLGSLVELQIDIEPTSSR